MCRATRRRMLSPLSLHTGGPCARRKPATHRAFCGVLKVALALAVSASCGTMLPKRPASNVIPPGSGDSSSLPRLEAQCKVLAEAESGELNDLARYEEFLPVNLGALLFEVRTDLDVPAVAREQGIEEVTSVICPSGNRAIWFPGFNRPEVTKNGLVKAAAKAQKHLEVIKWIGIGPVAAQERLRERCRDASTCARIAAAASPILRCCALELLGYDIGTYQRCEKLPSSKTECALRAVGLKDPITRRRCLDGLGSEP